MVYILASIMTFTMVGCKKNETKSGKEEFDKITITALNGKGEETKIDVPYNPKRIAILDMAALDILDNLGLGDRVVGCADTSLDYLKKYTDKDNVKPLGTIKEADLEAVMACEPDIIFIGGRLSESYEALSEIAPVVYLSTDTEIGLVKSTLNNTKTIASIFGKEDEVSEKFVGFEKRISALREIAQGKKAVIGMSTSGNFNVIGNGGRLSLIGVEVGFDNLNKDVMESRRSEKKDNKSETSQSSKENGNSTHGKESSFELLVSQNPEYIFVLDRDSAIGTEGVKLAQEIMDNELVRKTDAFKKGNLVILENPAVWYTAEGGISALDIMISDLEKAVK